MVFQGRACCRPSTWTENIALPLLLAGGQETQSRERAAAALHDVGLDELAARLPRSCPGSGPAGRGCPGAGRQAAAHPRRRADRAARLAHAAQVVGLLLDARHLLGAALVLSTHDLAIADRFPDRWQMADGLMIAEDAEGGTPC